MAPRKKDSNETPKKKEFGTGLRAQLEKRREEPEAPAAADAQPNVELRFELTARPADHDGTASSDAATSVPSCSLTTRSRPSTLRRSSVASATPRTSGSSGSSVSSSAIAYR